MFPIASSEVVTKQLQYDDGNRRNKAPLSNKCLLIAVSEPSSTVPRDVSISNTRGISEISNYCEFLRPTKYYFGTLYNEKNFARDNFYTFTLKPLVSIITISMRLSLFTFYYLENPEYL